MPAGMKDTGSAPESEPLAERSMGYRRGPQGLQPNTDTLPPRGTAAGGGYSTAHDMLAFANALLSHALLSKESTELLTTGKVETGMGQVQALIPVGPAPEVFAVDFAPDHPDGKAGVAFIVSAPRGEAQNDVCFDDISVTGG